MILSVDNLSFAYGKNKVLKGISLNVCKGEIVCLMGPNGSGKTTLLDCIMGFNRFSEGKIELNGKSIRDFKTSELSRNISYVPQHHSPTFPYTVRDVVLMGRTAYTSLLREPTKQDEEYCNEAMKKVGISDFADRPYTTLSGGEIKLVLLARALCQHTDIIILDEPTASLDFRNELIFIEILTRLIQDEGLTVIMATHVLNQAFLLESKECNVKAVMMSDGQKRIEGVPSEVITSESLSDIYNVNAAILETETEGGSIIKSVSLLNVGGEEYE